MPTAYATAINERKAINGEDVAQSTQKESTWRKNGQEEAPPLVQPLLVISRDLALKEEGENNRGSETHASAAHGVIDGITPSVVAENGDHVQHAEKREQDHGEVIHDPPAQQMAQRAKGQALAKWLCPGRPQEEENLRPTSSASINMRTHRHTQNTDGE